jgi:hypothetical protein
MAVVEVKESKQAHQMDKVLLYIVSVKSHGLWLEDRLLGSRELWKEWFPISSPSSSSDNTAG